MVDWNDRTVKGPEDFHAAVFAGSCGVTPQFALGYAQALYDARVIDMGEMNRYAVEVGKAESERLLYFPQGGEAEREED